MNWPWWSAAVGFQSLNAATAAATGKAVVVGGSTNFGLQVIATGSPVACIVLLQGSNDGGVTWFTLLTWSIATPQNSGDILFAVSKPVGQVRANCTSLSSSATVTAYISAS
jgi:hypothetical protein